MQWFQGITLVSCAPASLFLPTHFASTPDIQVFLAPAKNDAKKPQLVLSTPISAHAYLMMYNLELEIQLLDMDLQSGPRISLSTLRRRQSMLDLIV